MCPGVNGQAALYINFVKLLEQLLEQIPRILMADCSIYCGIVKNRSVTTI